MATAEQGLILEALKDTDSKEWLNLSNLGLDQAKVQSAVLSLASRNYIEYQRSDRDIAKLTEEGHELLTFGSHEARVLKCLIGSLQGMTMDELKQSIGLKSAQIGSGRALKLGWIKRQGLNWYAQATKAKDEICDLLKQVEDTNKLDEKDLKELKHRKLVTTVKEAIFLARKGENYSLETHQKATDLTAEMIQNGAWKDAGFKAYNFNAFGKEISTGALHPLNKIKTAFKEIFFEFGFEEMAGNQYTDSAFWNFDALFVPQQHSARDLQDTFYLSDPKLTDKFPDFEYLENVKKVHEGGLYGSLGYGYKWSQIEASRLVLRTHTTSRSAAVLSEIAKSPEGFKPRKIFSIDRVFRNEAVDATHLAEFHQIEGIIIDYNLTLGDLIGFMQTFFSKLGIENLRFKPTYNPYTEPSMEIFSYHTKLKKWVEIGNSGMFRPEMLSPMGFPPDVRALGWGLSLERPTMIKYGLSDIRQLMGPRVNLDIIASSASVRLDQISMTA